MTEYRCPSCDGGFPAAALEDEACPWCEQTLGDVDQERYPLALSAEGDGDGPANKPFGGLFT